MVGKARLKPWEIRRLTLPEMCLLLDDDLEKASPPPGGRRFTSTVERDDWIKELRSMTPLERLQAAREGR